jgi:hypothetical protein
MNRFLSNVLMVGYLDAFMTVNGKGLGGHSLGLVILQFPALI